MVSLEVLDRRLWCCRLQRIEELIGRLAVVLESVVGLGHIAPGVVLGQEATAVEMITQEDDGRGFEHRNVRKHRRRCRLIDKASMRIGDDHSQGDPALGAFGLARQVQFHRRGSQSIEGLL